MIFLLHCKSKETYSVFSFSFSPVTSPDFCKDSARSLVAYYNDGALPCQCNLEGATSLSCSPTGGQCSCRPNIIGRTCSQCSTGYYGFPNCRRKFDNIMPMDLYLFYYISTLELITYVCCAALGCKGCYGFIYIDICFRTFSYA